MAELYDVGAMVPLAHAAITSPVEYVDITLPTGYDHFVLRHTGWKQPDYEPLSAAMSKDGGDTFYCDATNFDTYGQLYDQLNLTSANVFSGFRGGTRQNNSLINSGILDFEDASDGAVHGHMTIYPGSATRVPSVAWELFYASVASMDIPGDATCDWYRFIAFLNPAADDAPVLGRVNLIRLLPYGAGDCDPPTSGYTFTEGSYHLFGAPTP